MPLIMLLIIFALLQISPPAQGENRPRPEDAFAHGNPAFCTPKAPVRDFGLSQLPQARQVPESGDLPFGPKTVSLVSFEGHVLPLGQPFGYELLSENYHGHTPLHWNIQTRMLAISRSGQLGREVDSKQITVDLISSGDEAKLYLDPPRKPGFYRYDIEIVNGGGELLGSYSDYLKVFKRFFWKARLGLSGHSFHAGDVVLSRVENLGTEWTLYGEEFTVQRFKEGRWRPTSSLNSNFFSLGWEASAPATPANAALLGYPPMSSQAFTESSRRSNSLSDWTPANPIT